MVVCAIKRTDLPAFTKCISCEGAEKTNKDDDTVNLLPLKNDHFSVSLPAFVVFVCLTHVSQCILIIEFKYNSIVRLWSGKQYPSHFSLAQSFPIKIPLIALLKLN